MNTSELNTLIEQFKNATPEQRLEISQIFSNINVNNRNVQNINEFSEQIIKKENVKKTKYVKIMESDAMNGIITAPTQVGKSDATRELIETAFRMNVPVIVSTDNKTDQQEQLYNRMQNGLCGAYVKLLKVNDKTFQKDIDKIVKEENNRFVIFCLDNSSQIKKLKHTIGYLSIKQYFNIKKIMLVHDEGDVVTKDQDVERINEEQPESHKEWMELMNDFKTGNIDVKRIFVTATPDNCMMLYGINNVDIISLEIPSDYTGWKDINYNIMKDDLDTRENLIKVVNKIKLSESYEVILYCVDRKIENGQDIILNSLSETLNCTVNTYNSNGIVVIFNKEEFNELFHHELWETGVVFKRHRNKFTMPYLSIRKFYTLCKKIGETCVVTIGKDLISRGISYVGEDKNKPFTASVMFYKPGTKMHVVGMCQTIGRITGRARPELRRELFASEDVIINYKNYNTNQEKYMKIINDENTDDKLSKDIINDLTFNRLTRNIDRPALNLKINMIEDTLEDTEGFIDGVNVKKLRNWLNDDSLVGKIIRYLFDQESEITDTQIKEEIEYNGTLEEFKSNLRSGSSQKSKYGKLWLNTNNKVIMNEKIKNYIKDNNL
jgi:hypothetical protein